MRDAVKGFYATNTSDGNGYFFKTNGRIVFLKESVVDGSNIPIYHLAKYAALCENYIPAYIDAYTAKRLNSLMAS